MSARRSILATVLVTAACSSGDAPSGQRRPEGTPADPVVVCERVADVCRLDGSRLGVCTQAAEARCQGRTPCLVCMAQH